jgi:hypothetical protein
MPNAEKKASEILTQNTGHCNIKYSQTLILKQIVAQVYQC